MKIIILTLLKSVNIIFICTKYPYLSESLRNIKMNSIKPELGKGLGSLHDKNRGKIFPSIKINFNKEFDDLFSCYPILITNNKESEKKLKIRTYSSIEIPEIETILKKFNSNSLIIRPDRFVLASTDKSDLKEFSRFYLNEIFAS